MEVLNKGISKAMDRPIKILQFGEGNFLRAFVDYMIDVANEEKVFDGNIAIIKPIAFGNLEAFHRQEYQYTLSLRGKENGETKIINRVITSIADAVACIDEYERYASYGELDTLRFIVSNTTESGIVFDDTDCFDLKPPITYPGKLTKLLFERYTYFKGDKEKGLIIIPCELIEKNGTTLKQCILQYAKLWNLKEGFKDWINEACIFCNTLVDRIVTGYPKEEAKNIWKELGYQDDLLDTCEIFGLWVIESDKDISKELPLDKANLPVIFTDNQQPFRERKVSILNGAHTSFALASFLAGNDYILESMEDKDIRGFLTTTIFDEIIPTLSLPKEELVSFANSVLVRFENPYIKHALLSISLNSVSKWKTRCLPSFKGYVKRFGKLPVHLSFSIAALMRFYEGDELSKDSLIGHREGQTYNIMDDSYVLEFFAAVTKYSTKEFVQAFLSEEKFFGEDMTKYEGLVDLVCVYLEDIKQYGMRESIRRIKK